MSDKYRNKYRIPSARLQNWDYGSNAMYFVTICTKNREHYFCNFLDRKMILTDIGEIVESEWIKTPGIRPDMNLRLGEFVVMPNHFHAIITIGENEFNTQRGDDRRDAMHCVSADQTDQTDQTNQTNQTHDNKNKFGPQSKNLASIIRGFKSAVTVNARKIHADFAWQPRFHDHIIRNDESFHRISNYILTNPSKWVDDKFYNPS